MICWRSQLGKKMQAAPHWRARPNGRNGKEMAMRERNEKPGERTAHSELND
jgi:hypothetical protein